MPDLQIKANELVDTRVDFIALVKRGANRIPFRIVKQENEEMLDLQKIGRSLFKKAEAAPEVIAAVVPAGSDLEMLAKLFEDAGLDSTAFLKTEIDGVVTLAKADADKAEDTVVIKSGDIGLVITGLKKGFDAWSVEADVRPLIVCESEDVALLQVFGQEGMGLFAAPTVVEAQIRRQYNVRVVGRLPEVRERFYAISAERKLAHPAVVAITDAARKTLFG